LTAKEIYKFPEYLVETEWLEHNLDSPELKIFDCTASVVKNPDATQQQKVPFVYESGLDNYKQAHIPHAGHIDVPGMLSDPSSNLPLMMLPEEQFVSTMKNYGISNDSHVVLYSTSEPNWATRVWWMLRSFGFNNVAILNGGWKKWNLEERPTSTQACNYLPEKLSLKLRSKSFVDKMK